MSSAAAKVGTRVIAGSAKTQSYAQNYTDRKWRTRRDLMMQARQNAKDERELAYAGANQNHAPAANLNRAPRRRNNPLTKLSGGALNLVSGALIKMRAINVSFRLGYAMTSLYLTFQLPLYLFGLLFFLGSIINSVPTTPWGFVVEVLDYFFEFLPDIGIFSAISIGLNGINTGICWTFMIVAAIMYSISGIHWWGGKKSGIKAFWFMFALVAYGCTFFQFLPWALPWLYVVGRNPE